jgi:hypothetical protein
MMSPEFMQISKSFFVCKEYEPALRQMHLTSVDAVFSYGAGTDLNKSNLASYRTRIRLELVRRPNDTASTAFLKRYNKPPVLVQLKSWLCRRGRKSLGACDFQSAADLQEAGVNTPKTIAFGETWGLVFERRSFSITEKIADAESLEQKLPDCFKGVGLENLKARRQFIAQLAAFIRSFHETGYRHRDLYFAHIFRDSRGGFYLIDLTRAFKPFLAERFRRKDIAQLFYSAPGRHFSGTDRLRFYLAYTCRSRLTVSDKQFIRKVLAKANRIARHDRKHGRSVPFAR